MTWIQDRLPLAAARPGDDDEPLEVGLHVMNALAAGVAVMELMVTAAHGQLLQAAFWAAAFAATGTCVVAWGQSDRHLPLVVAGGACSVVVWLALALQAPGSTMPVALGMALLSGAMTRHLVVGRDSPEGSAGHVPLPESAARAWIDDDVEGFLPL